MKRRQTAVVASVALSLISIAILGVLRKTASRVPFFRKLFQLQNLGLDSMKDFLEISELNLRTESPSIDYLDADEVKDNKGAKLEHEITWDSDGSDHYTIFISSEYIGKLRLLDSSIELLMEQDVVDLKDFTNWIRKIKVHKDELSVNSVMNTCSYTIPFEKFNCRVRSSNGRVSRHFEYPAPDREATPDREVDCWVVPEGDSYYFYLMERNGKSKSIYEYQLVIYLNDGKGLVRTVPPFKQFLRLKLGSLPSGLCYLTGVRSVGVPFEQYVGWIGEHNALTLDGELAKYADVEQLEFMI